jgi:hypothetical protein
LERDAQEEMTVLVCPDCAEEFELYGDPALEFIAHEWAKSYQGETYGPPTDPEMAELSEHAHDPSALIDRATGEPWLERLSGWGGHREDQ